MTFTATLSSKFQISIPKAVREEQHWQAGQEFVFIPKGKGVLVMPLPELSQWPASPRMPARTVIATARTATDGTALRVVDTSAWIEWLVGSALGRGWARFRQAAVHRPPSCSWSCPSGWCAKWVKSGRTR
jgi:AbrB family looped-hinge helix DNA binding protein